MKINQYFNLKRFFLLLKKDFYTQYKTYMVASGAILAVLFIINIASIATAGSWNFNHVFYPLTLFIGGYIFTSQSFRELFQEQSSAFYMTIPASSLEKFISKLFITSIGYVIISLLLYFFYSIIVSALSSLIFGISHQLFNPFTGIFLNCIRIYLITQSIFFAGALYFKKNSFLKTICAVFIIVLIYVVFVFGIGFLLFKTISFNTQIYISFDILNTINYTNTNYFPILYVIKNFCTLFFTYLLAPLMWIVAFFRLKEIEV